MMWPCRLDCASMQGSSMAKFEHVATSSAQGQANTQNCTRRLTPHDNPTWDQPPPPRGRGWAQPPPTRTNGRRINKHGSYGSTSEAEMA
ncbi:hypothetical protein Y1Q_0001580 [Alligator mississippiensis]|uniref:Uncharacterized protein n=1 Tax=Alligator mississippiensis TaxID=8496 RepID=A0A151MA15_ALLMI|nr:hypothetical protein Y1Q_0001580 [Alligator mississippiensis]